jgi:hypothetical protein
MPSTTETLKELNPAIDAGDITEVPGTLRAEWRMARMAKRRAIEREAEVSNRLRAVMGRSEFAGVGGVAFAKRSIRKRAGYEVAPGQQDELRELSSGGESPAAGSVWASVDPEAAPPGDAQGAGGPGVEGAGVGDRDSGGAGGAGAEGVAPVSVCRHCGDGTDADDPAPELCAMCANAGRTSGGVELTDELIERLADEAEAGYVGRLRPPPRSRASKIPHPSGDDGGDGTAWDYVPRESEIDNVFRRHHADFLAENDQVMRRLTNNANPPNRGQAE